MSAQSLISPHPQCCDKIVYSNEVQKAIDQVLNSTDPLDSQEFNSIEYINQLFPNEQSLINIDEIIAKMECEITVIDDNIRGVVRSQTNTALNGRLALTEAQQVIQQLFLHIQDIKLRAEKTELMIKEITRDIKQLDSAKKNLTTAITSLNHLHMLVGGIENLNQLIEKRLYGEIINPLQAIIEVNSHFQQYYDIQQIKDLSCSVAKIQNVLAEQITKDFHNAFASTSTTSNEIVPLSQLTNACKVVSVLDPKLRRDLLKWFITIQLEEYVQLFHENQDIAWLDKIDKRYAWLKRCLLQFEEKFASIFPVDWEVSERIAVQFCQITNESLTKIMKKRHNEIDVKLLLFAITKTQQFEELLAKRFTGCTLNETTNDLPEHQRQFFDCIGECFKAHLDIYVDSCDKNLAELFERFVQQNKQQSFNQIEAKSSVFASCADLFVFYKKCMVQSTQLSNGKPMLDLAMIFKKYLREYAIKILETNIPKITQNSLGTSMSLLTRDLQNLSTAAGQVINNLLKEGEAPRFSKEELIRICCVLTTAEYCLETVQQLENKLKEKIDSKYAENIDLIDEQDIFHRIISNCIQLLVQDLENGCESALLIMSRVQWQNIVNVGDQSTFVNIIINNFKQTIPIIRDNLATSRKYFTQFCHKFINSFTLKFINTLYKCRLIQDGNGNVLGCEQLLLDTHSIKTVILDLPSVGSTVNRKAPTSYTKVVVNGMTKAEMIIKIVMTQVQPVNNFNKQVLKLLPDITIQEYQKILDMKGLKRLDQMQLIDSFKKSLPSSGLCDSNVNSTAKTDQIIYDETNIVARTDIQTPTVTENQHDKNVINLQQVEFGPIKRLEKLIKKRLPN